MTERRATRHLISLGATVSLVVVATACGGDDGAGLSEQAQRGRQTAISNGCASCHGTDGQGGVGPTWRGIAGTEVELADGTTVVRDDAYLLRSILEPTVEVVPGYNVNMPENGLTEEQALDVIAYIEELAADDAADTAADG